MKYTFSEGQWRYSEYKEFKDFESLDSFLKFSFNEENYLRTINMLKSLDNNFKDFRLDLNNGYFSFSKNQ